MQTAQQKAIDQINQRYAGTTTTSAPPKPSFLQKAGNFVGGVAKDALNTLVVNPGVRIGQAVSAPFAINNLNSDTALQENQNTNAQMLSQAAKRQTDPVKKQQLQQQAARELNQNNTRNAQSLNQSNALGSDTNIAGVTVAPQQSGLKGAEQIGGQALKAGSYLYGGEGLATLDETAGIGARALQGAKTFGVAGAAGNAGQAMEQGGNLGQVASGAIQGGLVGAITGGVIGGASAAIHPIFKRSNPIMNPEDVNLTNAEQGVNEAQNGLSAANQNVNFARQNLSPELKAQENLSQAQQARGQATTNAVQGINDIQTGVKSTTKGLGTNFSEGAQAQHLADPGTTVPLTKSQLEQLNAIRESKKFALPNFANTEGTQASIGGKPIDLGPMNPKVAAQIGATGNEVGLNLTRPQMQDLMTQVNAAVFDSKASGEYAVNQQLIGLRNELKATASKTFGSNWDNLYSTYSKGINAVNDLKNEINLNSKTPLDKTMGRIQKLGESPEGKAILQQYLENTRKETGLDLSDPVKAIHQVMESQTSLEGANTQLKEAQDAYSQALKEMEKNKTGAQENLQTAQATLQQVHEEIAAKIAKGGYVKQVITGLKKPGFATRRIGYAIGTVVGVSVAATAFRKAIGKFLSGQ